MLRTIASRGACRQRRRSGRWRASWGARRDLGGAGMAPRISSPGTSRCSSATACCAACSGAGADGAHPRAAPIRSRPSRSLPRPSPSAPSLGALPCGNAVVAVRHMSASTNGPLMCLFDDPANQSCLSKAQSPRLPARVWKRHKVFVSRHNNTLNLAPHDIMSYLASQLPHLNPAGDDFRVTSSHVVLKECPFCPKPSHGRADNQHKLYVAIGGGAYFCHRCGAKGSWYDLKSELGGFAVEGPGGAGRDRGDSQTGEVAQPWNWNTSNNQGMGYVSTQQLVAHPHGGGRQGNGYNQKHQTTPLPMPPKRLGSVYAAKLFDPANSPTHNAQEHAALLYLTETRGLSRAVLRKYGVGCAPYNFPDKDAASAMNYVSSMCVTFPWLMRAAEVSEQEELRGAEFVWKTEEAEKGTKAGREAGRGGSGGAPSARNDRKPSQMTALERYHHRRAKKDAKLQQAAATAGDDGGAALPPPTPTMSPPVTTLTAEEAEERQGPYLLRRLKVRSVDRKAWQRLDPPGGGFGLFGWHTVPHDAEDVVLTEGEFDAMAVSQATGRPAISLPNGCRSLPSEVILLLERFETVHLWMDNDGPGREGAEMFARKLGVERCRVVRPSGRRGRPPPGGGGGQGAASETTHNEDEMATEARPPEPPKDANEALLQGWDLNELLEEASELPHERILKFSDLREQVIHEIINPEKYRGTSIPSLPGFSSLIKGFRRGEMTVLTGPTGSGKTTFLGQTSLDLAEQGINVLWGSFEIKNTRLMHKLLQQHARDVLPVGLADNQALPAEERQQRLAELTALADKFETLPLYFMKFHGGSDVDDVLDAMEYAAYVHDVEHVILDNMQFMISRQVGRKQTSSYDKFEMQDIAIEKFRKFATQYNVHVTLVVHPRKEDEGAKLGISSFYGGAKATQEADTVLILQSDGKRKFIDVRKNRFDGALGHVPLYFQRKSGRYQETDPNVAPRRTVIPNGVSTTNVTKKPVASTYDAIRNQHPIE